MADDPQHQHPEPAGGINGWTLVGLGGLMVGAVVAGMVLGVLADRWFDTDSTFTLVGVFSGVAMGIAGSWSYVRRALRG